MSTPRAAVDVGSNSVRLLVTDATGTRLTRRMTVTRLATGVDRTGQLDDVALERTVAAIAAYREVWLAHGVTDRVRVAATSAVRDAADRDRFFTAVEAATGVRAEVLTGETEAALSFAGATSAIGPEPPAVVLDIGGGSTEIIVGDAAGRVAGSVSLQLGCVRLTERDLLDDPPSSGQLRRAEATIADRLAAADERLAYQSARVPATGTLIAVAGTATTLGALHLGLEEYREERIHGVRIPAASVRELTTELAGLSAGDRAELGPMQPGREDVIHGGAMILSGVMQHYGFAEVVVSESDSLDGLVASLG